MISDNVYTGYGVIGKSGRFYPCEFGQHIFTALQHGDDYPFVDVYIDHDPAVVLYERGRPEKKHFEAVMDMCKHFGLKFEDVAIGPGWDYYLG